MIDSPTKSDTFLSAARGHAVPGSTRRRAAGAQRDMPDRAKGDFLLTIAPPPTGLSGMLTGHLPLPPLSLRIRPLNPGPGLIDFDATFSLEVSLPLTRAAPKPATWPCTSCYKCDKKYAPDAEIALAAIPAHFSPRFSAIRLCPSGLAAEGVFPDEIVACVATGADVSRRCHPLRV